MSVTSDTDPVLYEVRDTGVAVLTLNRPERMNGWGGGLATAFYERLDDAEADPAVRAIVVTGSGRAFCAGADMGSLNTISTATVDGAGGTDVGKLVGARHPHFVMTMRKPVVAAINGACAGMGLTMALVCDVRFAAAGAKFTTSFARRGLIAEYGISWILPRVVGWGTALDLLLSGRVFLADEAAELGLVKEVVPPDELLPRAIGYAEDIAANCAPSSLAVIKQQVYADTMRDVFEAKRPRRKADARVDAATRLHRRHHEFLRKAPAQLSASEGGHAMTLDYKAIDVDNHYYETLDSCTRHLPKEFKRRGVQMVQDGKRTWAVMGEKVNHFIPNPTFDPIIEPGCLDLLFRGEIPEGVDPASLMKVDRLGEHPEYQNRDARVKILDRQNLETVFMLPTFACGVEEALKHDVEATMATVHAFNLWLDEDWGFDRPDHRIISAPIISLADPDKAVEEVEYVLGKGAKMVLVRPAPVPGVVKPRSLGDPVHDPVWARLAEAGVPVGFHLSDSGYLAIAALWGGKATFEGFGKKDPLDQVLLDDRAIHDAMASMIVHQVFTRHPRLKVASIENGSYFVYRLIKRLKKAANIAPYHFKEDPVEQLKNNVWIAPYYEDDVKLLAETIGVDKILFGSDWPHGEGLADPMAFTADIPQFPEFSAEDTRKVMRDNALDLLGAKVPAA